VTVAAVVFDVGERPVDETRAILPRTTITVDSLGELPEAFARPDARPAQETAR